MRDYMRGYRAAQSQRRRQERNQLAEIQRRLEKLEKFVLGDLKKPKRKKRRK